MAKNNLREVKLMEENNIRKTYEEWASFLKDELKRIDTQIGHYGYGKNLEKITKLWEFRKVIVNEISVAFYKEEISFLEGELKRIETQIKAYKYGGPKEILDKVIELFELRKIIVEEIKKTIEDKGPQIHYV